MVVVVVVFVVVVVVTRGGGAFSCLAPVRRESFRQTSVVSKAGLCELLIIGFSSLQTLPPATSSVFERYCVKSVGAHLFVCRN